MLSTLETRLFGQVPFGRHM